MWKFEHPATNQVARPHFRIQFLNWHGDDDYTTQHQCIIYVPFNLVTGGGYSPFQLPDEAFADDLGCRIQNVIDATEQRDNGKAVEAAINYLHESMFWSHGFKAEDIELPVVHDLEEHNTYAYLELDRIEFVDSFGKVIEGTRR